MKLNNLKFYLTGAGSTLDIFPNSDPDDELLRICEIARRYDETYATAGISSELVELAGTCNGLQVQIKHFYPQSDKDSLRDDWRSVGADLLSATQRAKSALLKSHKDESECWSS